MRCRKWVWKISRHQSRGTRRLPFRHLLHQSGGEVSPPFPWLLYFTLALYILILSIKQRSVNYHFLSLWYDSTWDWTPICQAIGEYFSHFILFWSLSKIWARSRSRLWEVLFDERIFWLRVFIKFSRQHTWKFCIVAHASRNPAL